MKTADYQCVIHEWLL